MIADVPGQGLKEVDVEPMVSRIDMAKLEKKKNMVDSAK